jgi:hypothetical protein
MGPWTALSRSMKTFALEVFLAIVDRMNRNMAPVLTVLMPGTMLSIIPVLLVSYHQRPMVFYLNGPHFCSFSSRCSSPWWLKFPSSSKSSLGRPPRYRKTGTSSGIVG